MANSGLTVAFGLTGASSMRIYDQLKAWSLEVKHARIVEYRENSAGCAIDVALAAPRYAQEVEQRLHNFLSCLTKLAKVHDWRSKAGKVPRTRDPFLRKVIGTGNP